MAEEKKEETKSLAEIPLPTASMLVRKIARAGSSQIGDDLYSFYIFCEYMIQLVGEEKLIQTLIKDNSSNKDRLNKIGENFKKFKRRFKEFGTKVTELKFCWDMIQEKKFDKLKDSSNFIKMTEYAIQVPDISEDLFALVVFFIANTGLKNMSIPNEAWTVQDLGQKTFKIDKDRLGQPQIHRE